MFAWFSKEWREIKYYRRESLICLVIFVAAVYAGYIMAIITADRTAEYYNTVRDMILANPFGNGLPENLFLYILIRNSVVSFTVLVLGIITYNLWPVFVLLLNGFIGGLAVKMQAVLFNYYTFQIWLFGLLPHGVPELGALFLAAGASFHYRRLHRKGERVAGRVLSTYLAVVLPLLILAAAVETFITPLLINRYLL
ncbi:stage II sporulation protein M [Desulfallas thermosapovorans]|uniref:Stage II sporulation protein M n=1 Tax=Desulfallas thermosapovorans DSM 6562 TaxID=1121431 RepID=A0A5S4ZT33_9FIRM|nr:stage II sporulation protein M [Desulfallas thermosapovorans]TYO96007.1 stage II sporulation protein M [Desulfallas thermosapovorans DSM 6562]